MKALGILSALFAGLNGVDIFQDAPQAKNMASLTRAGAEI